MYKKIEKVANDIVKLNVSKKNIDKFNLYLTIFILLSMMIPRILYNFTTIKFEYIYNYYPLLLIPMLYIFIYNIKHKHHKNTLDFILATSFMVVALISSIRAFNPWMAFLGDASRKSGYITYILYYFLYINSRNINDKDDIFKILNVMFIIGIINTIFAFLEAYLPYNNIFNKMYVNMGYGLMGNPNFLGTFALLLLSLSLYISLFIKENKFYKIVTFIMFICLLLASSTGPFLTFLFMLFILFVYIIIKRRDLIKKIFIYIAIFIILFLGIEFSNIYINQYVYKYEVSKTSTISNDVLNIIKIVENKFSYKDTLNDEAVEVDHEYTKVEEINAVSSGRLLVYKLVLQYIDYNNYLLLGTGPDNMHIYHIDFIYGDYSTTSEIDKAHNIYLNVMAETGLFSLIIALTFIVYYHIKAIKCKNSLVYLLLFGLISYNIQGLLNIDIFTVMPYYFIIVGMLIGTGDKIESKKH